MHENNRLGEEVIRPPKRCWDNQTIRKLVSFVFKYRPIGESYSFPAPLTQELSLFFVDVLMADGIAPPQKNTPRKKKALADPEDIIDLTLDDARRNKERKGNGTTGAAFKSEINEKKPITFDTEIIDLT